MFVFGWRGGCHQGDSEGSRGERPFLGRKWALISFHTAPPPASPRNNKLKGRFCFPRCSRRGRRRNPGPGSGAEAPRSRGLARSGGRSPVRRAGDARPFRLVPSESDVPCEHRPLARSLLEEPSSFSSGSRVHPAVPPPPRQREIYCDWPLPRAGTGGAGLPPFRSAAALAGAEGGQ